MEERRLWVPEVAGSSPAWGTLMKIKILKDAGSLKAGGKITLGKNEVNYFVGPNGSGKTILLGALAEHLKAKTEKPCWFAYPPSHIGEKFSFSGFEDVSKVFFFTGKTRQAQWVDMDYTLSGPNSVFSLHSSEGMNAQVELVSAVKGFLKDPDSLVIFDEIDSNFDLKAKKFFWSRVLPNFKGTVIVVTHDPYFPLGEKVLDFSDLKYKPFKEYYDSQ